MKKGHCVIRRAGCVEGKGSRRRNMGLRLEGYERLKETIGMYQAAGPKEFSSPDTPSLQWLEKETGQISLG